MTDHSRVDLTGPLFTDGFADWISINDHIWKAFVSEAGKVYNQGRRHYSARTIVEVLRHNSTLREASGEWKINNNRVPDMARLYMKHFPERDGFFQLRD